MKTAPSKNSVDQIALLTWEVLTNALELRASKKKLAPIYFFSAPWSEGSLRNRSFLEIDLVHWQQRNSQGITLISPPAAWVSTLEQVPEEAAHLFALVHQNYNRRSMEKFLRGESSKTLESMSLHETFGKFGETLILPRAGERIRRASGKTLWEAAHRRGYIFGKKLANLYFEERITAKQLRKWFELDWFDERQAPKALKYLKNILKI